jgi:hypothetical protein
MPRADKKRGKDSARQKAAQTRKRKPPRRPHRNRYRPHGTWERINAIDALELWPCPKDVLRALAGYEDLKAGRIYPSVQTLAVKITWSSRQVRRALRELESHGYLRTRPHKGGSSHYFIIWRRIMQSSALHPGQGGRGKAPLGKSQQGVDKPHPGQGGRGKAPLGKSQQGVDETHPGQDGRGQGKNGGGEKSPLPADYAGEGTGSTLPAETSQNARSTPDRVAGVAQNPGQGGRTPGQGDRQENIGKESLNRDSFPFPRTLASTRVLADAGAGTQPPPPFRGRGGSPHLPQHNTHNKGLRLDYKGEAHQIFRAKRPHLLEKYKDLPTYQEIAREAKVLGFDRDRRLNIEVPQKNLGPADIEWLKKEWEEVLSYPIHFVITAGNEK